MKEGFLRRLSSRAKRDASPVKSAQDITFERIKARLPRKIIVVDVGCRWGFSDLWKQLAAKVSLYGFDPDTAECERLRPLYEGQDVMLVPLALADKPGERTLFLTENLACSSLYQPNPDLTAAMPELACASQTGTTTISVTTLDEWALTNGVARIDFLKLDIQGAELDVLIGGEASLSRVRALEVEVEFNPIYMNQPLFGDVDRYLRARGFELWKLSSLAHYSRGAPTVDYSAKDTHYYDSKGVTNNTYPGQLFWGHAYYIKSEIATLSKRGVGAAEQMICDAAIMHVLGFTDLSKQLYEKTNSTL
jgi:FkbM family methyltransferase